MLQRRDVVAMCSMTCNQIAGNKFRTFHCSAAQKTQHMWGVKGNEGVDWQILRSRCDIFIT